MKPALIPAALLSALTLTIAPGLPVAALPARAVLTVPGTAGGASASPRTASLNHPVTLGQVAIATGLATAPPGHVIMKAGSGNPATTVALATTGVPGGLVYAGRYRASNHAEDFNRDSEPGGGLPGGRFGLFYAPGGTQSNLYVHGTTYTAYLLTGAPGATIMTAAPVYGAYTALTYLPGGVAPASWLELTYLGPGPDGRGRVAFRPQGAGGPTADQLWKVTG